MTKDSLTERINGIIQLFDGSYLNANEIIKESQTLLTLVNDQLDELKIISSPILCDLEKTRTSLNSLIGSLKIIIDGCCDNEEEEKEFWDDAKISADAFLECLIQLDF